MKAKLVRLVSLVALAAGVFALLLAHLFSSLAPLSSSMGARAKPALLLGLAAAIPGVALSLLTAGQPGGPATAAKGAGTQMRPPAPVRPVQAARRAVRFAGPLVLGAMLGWFAFGVFIYAVQDQLVFSPRRLTPERLERVRSEYPQAQDVEIVSGDGTVLRGWLLPPWSPRADATGKWPLVIVFAGQGGEASGYFELSRWLPDMAWAFVNYRGYGASDGTPSDKGIFQDAVAVYDYFAARPDIDADKIFALGGSMGTGVATYLAAHRPVAAVVLFSPYDSINAGVARDIVPWLPTGLLFRNRFDAAAYAPRASAPAMAVVGDADLVIRPARSLELLRRWGGPTELLIVPGGDHYSIYETDAAWHAVQAFVRGAVK